MRAWTVLLTLCLCDLSYAATPVAVELKGPRTPFAQDVDATIRLALNASGAFFVVRTDLEDKISKAQRRFFKEAYAEESQLSPGEFIAPRVLVVARYQKPKKSRAKLSVSFTDMRTLKSLRNLDLRFSLDLKQPEESAARLALEIAKRVAEASGSKLDDAALARAKKVTQPSENQQATALYRKAQRAARALTAKGLLEASEDLRQASALSPSDLKILLKLLAVESTLARYSSWLGQDNDEASLARHDHIISLVEKLSPRADEHWMVKRELARAQLTLAHHERFDALIAEVSKAQPNDPDTLFLKAVNERTHAGAVGLLSRALKIDPLHAEARIERARRLSQRRQFEEARTDLLWVLKRISPDNLVARLILADIEYLTTHFSRARRLLNAAKKLYPKSSAIDYGLALTRAVTRKPYEKALRAALRSAPSTAMIPVAHPQSALYIKQAEGLNKRWPTHPMIALDLSRQYLAGVSNVDMRLALRVLDRVTHRNMPKEMKLLIAMHRAFALAGLNRHEEAIALIDRNEEGPYPRSIKQWMRFYKARYLKSLKRDDEARHLLSALVAEANQPVLMITATMELAGHYGARKEYQLAHRFIDRLGALPGTHAISALMRGQVLTAEGKTKDAIAIYEAGIANHGGFGDLRVSLAKLYKAAQRDDEAIEMLHRAARRDLNYLSALVISLVELRRHKQAKMILADFQAKHPQNAKVLSAKGDAFYLLGDHEVAKTAHLDAYHADPSWTRAKAVLRVLDAQQKNDEAIAFLKTGLSQAGRHRELYLLAIADRQLEKSRGAEALARLTEVKRLRGEEDLPLTLKISKALSLAGRLDEAEAKLRAVTKKKTLAPALITALAQVLVKKGRSDEALKLYTDSLSGAPNSRALQHGIIDLLLPTRRCKVLPRVDRWLAKDPGDVVKLTISATCHKKAGHLDKWVSRKHAIAANLSRDAESWTELAAAQLETKNPQGAMGALMIAYHLEGNSSIKGMIAKLVKKGVRPSIPKGAPKGFSPGRVIEKMKR